MPMTIIECHTGKELMMDIRILFGHEDENEADQSIPCDFGMDFIFD